MTKYLRKRDFEIKINNKSTVPIYEQIKRGIKLLIVSGYFKNGDHILSIRELASKLKVNPNTIIKVYYQLEAEGYLFSKPGTSYIVKIDEDKVKKEKFDFFLKETDEYLAKIISLGYSPAEAIKEIKKKIHKGGKKNDKD